MSLHCTASYHSVWNEFGTFLERLPLNIQTFQIYFMKTLFYLASILILLSACHHQKSVAASNAYGNNTQATPASYTQITTQGEVQIKTDESTTATITVYNPPDSVNTTTVVANNTTVVNDTNKNNYRLSISFISIGAGIDWQTQESFVKWLDAQPSHPKYDEYQWGREGEKDYCLKLTELSTREQEIFVRDVRTQLTDKPLVIVSEYAECKGKKVN